MAELTPADKLEEAVRQFISELHGDDVMLGSYFLAYSKQRIDEDGDVLFSRGYSTAGDVYGAVGVAECALGDAQGDLGVGENDEDYE